MMVYNNKEYIYVINRYEWCYICIDLMIDYRYWLSLIYFVYEVIKCIN
jgi:hypothetical protein